MGLSFLRSTYIGTAIWKEKSRGQDGARRDFMSWGSACAVLGQGKTVHFLYREVLHPIRLLIFVLDIWHFDSLKN